MLSNSDHVYVKECFDGPNITIQQTKTNHAINSKQPGNAVNKLLIRNF